MAAPLSPPTATTDPAPPARSQRPTARQELARVNQRWTALLVFAVLGIGLTTVLGLVGTAQRAREQRELTTEYRLGEQLTTLAATLRETEMCEAAYVGTGSATYRARFSRLTSELTRQSAITAPTHFPSAVQDRLKRLPSAVQSRLKTLEAVVAQRERGEIATAQARLAGSEAAAEALQSQFATLRSDLSEQTRRREQTLEQDLVRTQAETVLRAVGVAALLLVGFLLWRWDRRLQLAREKALRSANAKLASIAEEDGLTGLKNRRAFDERIRAEFRRSRRYGIPLSVLMLDVDHFKKFNDSYGHPVGDRVLRGMARVMAQTARLSDTIARYGGEEFAIILPHTTAEESLIVGERLKAVLHKTEWPRQAVTASIGIATLDTTMTDPAQLVRAADAALYQAKASGRDRVVHHNPS